MRGDAAVETRFHFFGGKGGAGKTTCAAATAVGMAETGRRVLLVSTDPAHSLRDVLSPGEAAPRAGGRRPGAGLRTPARVATARGRLAAVELDADRALARWMGGRRRHLRTLLGRATYLDDEDIDRFLGLSLPGVDELIGLIELHRVARARPYDDVVVDTAPTGHTLRLLAMPATLGRLATVLEGMQGKHRFLAESLGGGVTRDAADAVVAEMAEQGRALGALLRDRARCAFTWVLLPEPLALAETRDAVAALEAAGLPVRELLVNRVTPPGTSRCGLCDPRRDAEQGVVQEVRAAFAGRAVRLVPALDVEPRGVPALRRLAVRLRAASPAAARAGRGSGPSPPAARTARGPARRRARPAPGPAGGEAAWLSRLVPPGLRLLLVLGKGGVGKTSCAAAVALALAERRREGTVLLVSTDPAHSVADVLGMSDGPPAGRAGGEVVAPDPAARVQAPHPPASALWQPTPVPGMPALHALEVDAARAFAQRRRRYRAAVDALFAAVTGGSRFEVAFDRAVVQDLIELAPPGLDELFGALAVIEALGPASGDGRYAAVVLDTAPTGHSLRLLALPRAALAWVHALLEILLKYREVVGLGEVGADLLALARDLRALAGLLGDPARTRALVVTRAAALPVLETRRLLRAAGRLRLPLGALLVNEATPPGCPRCRRAAAAEARALGPLGAERRPRRCAMIVAPAVAPPPRGARALAAWRARWELTT